MTDTTGVATAGPSTADYDRALAAVLAPRPERPLKDRIEDKLTTKAIDSLIDRGYTTVAGKRFELEENDEVDAPLVLVGPDSERFEIDYMVTVTPLPPLPEAPPTIQELRALHGSCTCSSDFDSPCLGVDGRTGWCPLCHALPQGMDCLSEGFPVVAGASR